MNGATGRSDIEGKAVRVTASDSGAPSEFQIRSRIADLGLVKTNSAPRWSVGRDEVTFCDLEARSALASSWVSRNMKSSGSRCRYFVLQPG